MTPSNPLYRFFMRVQQNLADLVYWVIILAIVGGLIYGVFLSGGGDGKVTKTPSGPDTLLVADRPSPPLVRRNNVVVSDKEGRTFEEDIELEGYDYGTINIQGADRTTRIAIDVPRNRWFPDFSAPATPIKLLNRSTEDVVYTPPQSPIIDWPPRLSFRPSVGVGFVHGNPSFMIGSSPLGIGPSNIGIYLSITSTEIEPVFDVSVRILEHLEAGVGMTTQSAPSVSLRYRF